MKKVVSILLLFTLLICVATGLLGFYVAKKVKSGDYSFMSYFSMLNKGTSTDLGVTYTEAEIAAYHQRIQSEAKALTKDSVECKTMPCTPGKAIYIGSQRIDIEITNSEATGLLNEWIQLSPNAPFSSGQLKVNSDGTADFAGIVDMAQVKKFGVASNISAETMSIIDKYVGALGETFPLQVSGKLEIKNNVVTTNLTQVKIGIITVPTSLYVDYAPEINTFLGDRLKVVTGLSIEELTLTNGKVHFVGTIPKKVYFVK